MLVSRAMDWLRIHPAMDFWRERARRGARLACCARTMGGTRFQSEGG